MTLNTNVKKDRILVLGKGFLGKQFEKNGYRVLGKEEFRFVTDVHYADLSSFSVLKDGSYEVIINTIGKSNTRWCEKQENWKETFKVNSELPYLLSEHCKKHGKKLVHISSGCVYDENSRPQTEEDHVSSHCKYVVSKLAGEYGCDPARDLILRPRLFFGEDWDKNNLLSKISRFENFLTEVNSFTNTQTIVEATQALLDNEQVGIFNVAERGYTSLWNIIKSIGLCGGRMTGGELRSREGLYLVNNIMDTTKLEQFYTPREIFESVGECWKNMNGY